MTQWVRLWHDMPTDPKWRVIARKSGQPIVAVIAVFNLMMVCASSASDRGTLEGWNDEDAAACLDLDDDAVTAIRDAMQGKVLDGNRMSGWDKRQPKREDWSDGQRDRRRPSGGVWASLRSYVFRRDDFTCLYCGKRAGKLECDHVVPISRGGGNDLENLVTACFSCNRSKRNKLLSEWVR